MDRNKAYVAQANAVSGAPLTAPIAMAPQNHARGLQHHGRSAASKTAVAGPGAASLPAALAGMVGGSSSASSSGAAAAPVSTMSKERKQALFGGGGGGGAVDPPKPHAPSAFELIGGEISKPTGLAAIPKTAPGFNNVATTPSVAAVAGESQRDRRLRERALQRQSQQAPSADDSDSHPCM